MIRILSVVAFSSVLGLAPGMLAQSDPMATPASQTQPNQPGRVQAPTTSMQDSSGAPSDTMQQMKDKMFVRKAAEGGLAEVQLGKLAMERGASEDVKSFGRTMVEDHTQLNKEVAELADTIGTRLPKKMGKADQAEFEKLKGLSGEEFDKEYIAYMVKDHHEDLREFRVAASSTGDSAVKNVADHGARIIREHMILADKMAHERGIPMPGHPARPAATGPSPSAQ
jgi:putative membrane protein